MIKNKEKIETETKDGNLQYYANHWDYLVPFKTTAYVVIITSLIALLYELKLFQQFSNIIYEVRFTIIFLTFIALFISNLKFFERHLLSLIHFIFLSFVCSSAVIIYFLPHAFLINSIITGLIIFLAALYIKWDFKNQIIVIIYFSLIFIGIILFNKGAINPTPNKLEDILLVLFIDGIILIAHLLKNKLKVLGFEDIQKSEKVKTQLYDFFNDSIDGMFIIDGNGKILQVNNSFLRMFKIESKKEIREFNFFELFDNSAETERLILLIQQQSIVKNYRISFTRNNKQVFVWINCNITKSSKGNISTVMGVLHNITNQVRQEENRKKVIAELKRKVETVNYSAQKAQEASKIKTQFLANMSHEIRTPMNSVLGFLTLIKNGLYESEKELKEFAENGKVSAESLLDIINNILDISKIEAGKMELDESPFNLREEVDKSVSIVTSSAKEKGVNIIVDFDRKLYIQVIGDATRFRQILVNLIGNSVKFTDEGDINVTIKLNEIKDSKVEIFVAVKDNGPGILKEQLATLFKPFTQIKSKRTKNQGAGLGLMISKEFINLMGGNISVESEAGKGSVFSFTVIMKTYSEKEESVAKGSKEEYTEQQIKASNNNEEIHFSELPRKPHSKKRILLVEDNLISQNVELKILRDVGYNVDAVTNGKDAIEAVRSNSFNLVLMDLEMEGIDGIAATKEIRKLLTETAKIPIIAVTAHSSMEDRKRCLAAGMNDYVAKPININFLKIIIDHWLKEN